MGQFSWATAKHWVETQKSLNGVVIFSPVDADGIALFSSIFSAQFTAESPTGVVTAMPITALKTISPDLTTVTVNVATGTVLGLLGATLLAAPDGTTVHAHLVGV